MTTKVTVDAHAGWPVRVTAIDATAGEGPGAGQHVLGEVEAGAVREFHVYEGRKLLIEELSKPEAA